MPSVAELLVRIDATTESLRRELKSADASVVDFGKKVDRQVGSIDQRFQDLGAGVTRAMGAIGIAFGAQQLFEGFTRMADEATNMENRLRTVTDSAEDLTRVQEMLFASAQSSGVEMGTVVETYTRISNALKTTGIDAERVVDITDTLSKALTLSGATTVEAAQSLHQLGQSFNEGRLNGEEFNTVATNMPILLDAIAKRVAAVNGISFEEARASLKDMASEGEITAEVLVYAIEDMREDILRSFSEIEDTTERATTRMWNSLTNLVGKFDETTGASGIVIDKIDMLAAAFDFAGKVSDQYGGRLRALLDIIMAIPHPLEILAQAAMGAYRQIQQLLGLQSAMPDFVGNIGTMQRLGKFEVAAPKSPGARVGPLDRQDAFSALGPVEDRKPMAKFEMAAPIPLGDRPAPLDAEGNPIITITRPLTPAEKPPLKFTKKPDKAAARGASDQEREAARVFDQTRTAAEKYAATVDRLEALYSDKAISQDTFTRGLRQAQETFDKAEESARKKAGGGARKDDTEAKRVIEETRTAQERYAAEVERLDKMLSAGSITQDTYNRAIQRSKEELFGVQGLTESTRTASEAYNAEVERLKAALAAGAIDQETYNRAVEDAKEKLDRASKSGGGMGKAMKASADDMKEFSDVMKEVNQDLQDAARIFEETRTPMERYSTEFHRVTDLMQSGRIDKDTYGRKIAMMAGELNDNADRMMEKTQALDKVATDLGFTFASAFEDAIIAGKGFREILDSLLEDVQRIVLRTMVTQPLANALTGFIGTAMSAAMGAGMSAGAGGLAVTGTSSTAAQMGAVRGAFTPKFAAGGWVKGDGGDRSDNVLAMLSPGEFVVPAKVARANKQLLMGLPKYAAGGFVGGGGTAPANSNISVTLENQSSIPLKMEEQKQDRGPDGRHMIKILITDAVKQAMRDGQFDRTMGSRYGASVQPIGR